MSDFNDYADLGSTGYDSRQPVDPKDEFFHSVYISGVTRQNQEGTTEHAGNLHPPSLADPGSSRRGRVLPARLHLGTTLGAGFHNRGAHTGFYCAVR